MTTKANGTLKTVGAVLGILVSFFLIVSYAIPDTTEVHDKSTEAHPRMQEDITEMKKDSAEQSDTLISIRIHQQIMDKKLDKILEKLDN